MEANALSDEPAVHFREGRLYFTCGAFERFLAGSGGVVLLREAGDLLVLPVRNAAAGGFIPKIRNAAGDRVVNAAEFFRAQGVEENTSWPGAMHWNEPRAALILCDFFVT
jgi:hypothetical protein